MSKSYRTKQIIIPELLVFWGLILTSCFPQHLTSQKLSFRTIEAVRSELCQSNTTGLWLFNTDLQNISDVKVKLSLPVGIDYIPGSVLGALEFNINNLSNPEFLLTELKSGDSLALLIKVFNTCILFDAINQSQTFSNKWIISYGLEKDSISSAQNYSVETPYLVISDVADDRRNIGDKFQRKITITNTRLGSLSSFIFEDNHDHLKISSTSGNTVVENLNQLVLEFNAEHFKLIGDRDSLFERDEQIIIVEDIEHEMCIPQLIHSRFLSTWFCRMDTCQQYQEASTIEFITPVDLANIKVSSNATAPECICQTQGAVQTLILTNSGGAIAENFTVDLASSLLTSPVPFGIIPGSIIISGDAVLLDLDQSIPTSLTGCPGVEAFQNIYLKLSPLLPGQSVRIDFNYFICNSCAPLPGNEVYSWYYSYSWNSKCINGSEQKRMNLKKDLQFVPSVFTIKPELQTQDEQLINKKEYLVNCQIDLPKLSSDQNLYLSIEVPCPLRLKDSLFLLNGRLPDVITISGDTSYRIELVYFPNLGKTMNLQFTIIPDSNFLCRLNTTNKSRLQFISTCPNKQRIDYIYIANICFGAQLSCPGRLFDCGPCARKNIDVKFEYQRDEFVKDSIYAYLAGQVDVYRKNIGLKDDDNDRQVEKGTPNKDNIKIKNFITSDTIVFDFNLGVVKEDSRFNYDSISLIIGDVLEFDTLFSEVGILDISTGTKYWSSYPVVKKYSTPIAIPNCDHTIVDRNGGIGGYNIPMSVDSLNKYGANLPSNFSFDSGDSISVMIIGKIASVARDRIYALVIPYYAVIEDRQHIRQEPFSCISAMDTIYLATLGVDYQQTNEEIFLCGETEPMFVSRIEGTKELDNLFCNEFRELYRLKEINLQIDNDYIVIDSVRIDYFYRDSLNEQFLFSSRHLPIKRGIRWEFDTAEFKQFAFDESFIAVIYGFGRITDCDKYRSQSKTLISLFSVCSVNDVGYYNPPRFLEIKSENLFSRANEINIYNGFKELNISNKTLFTRSGRVSWSALISDLEQEGGFDFWIWSPSASISDLHISSDPATTIISIDPFTKRIISLKQFTNYAVQFDARFRSCREDTIYLISKWYCDHDSNQIFSACNQDTTAFFLIPEMAELELDLAQESYEVDLCDTLPEIILEFYNADKGSAFHPEIQSILPEGIKLILNECYYSYPKGNPLRALPAPSQVSSNVFVWLLEDFIPGIKTEGLKGVEDHPLNSIVLRLKMRTDCNSLVNSFPVFKVRAMNDCGMETNSIQKNGKLIKLKNISGESNLTLSLEVYDQLECMDTFDLYINVISTSSFTSSDSLRINLPEGLNYIPLSTFEIQNAPFREPKVITNSGVNELVYSFPGGITLNDSSKFRIKLSGYRKLSCEATKISAVAYKSETAWCSSTHMPCDVKVQRGMAAWNLPEIGSEIVLDTVSIEQHSDSSKVRFLTTIRIKNKQALRDTIIRLGLYFDLNSNGRLDAEDSLLTIISNAVSGLPEDSIYTLVFHFPNQSITHCSWILNIISPVCLCENNSYFFTIPFVIKSEISDSICSGRAKQFGVKDKPLYKYQWSGLSGQCDTCSMVEIFYPVRFDEDSTYVYILKADDGNGCVLENMYHLTVFKLPEGNLKVYESCPGDRIDVDAGNRKKFLWQGEGIIDPGSYFQSYINWEERNWLLNFIDENHCSGRDSFLFIPLIDTSSYYITGDTMVEKGKTTKICIVGGIRWEWDDDPALECLDCQCNEITLEEDGSFSITIWDKYDCPHKILFNIKIRKTPCDQNTVFVPNAFSPNGDLKNDVLYVHANNLSKINFVIYNRWGEKVFESFDVYSGWDGTYQGRELSPDVFAYYLEADCLGGEKIFKKGNISLLK